MSITTSNFRQHHVLGGPPSTDAELIGAGGSYEGASYELDLTGTGAWDEEADTFTLNANIPTVTDKTVYGVGGWYLDSTAAASTLDNAMLALRSSMNTNSTSSTISARSTSANDTGTLKIYGLIGGTGTIVSLDLDGTTTVATGAVFDSESVLWVEYVVSSAAAEPEGNITINAGAQVMGVLFGSSSGHGVYQINCLTEVAVASAVDTRIGWTGTSNTRLDPPTSNVGAFSNPGHWPGNLNAIDISAFTLDANTWFQVCIKITLVADMLLPPESGGLQVKLMVFGTEG